MLSHKMKSSQKQEAEVGLKNHNPGCVWGIFHNLQQNRWHKVVKNLPRARLGSGGKHSAGQEKGKAAPNAAAQVVQENADDIVDKCSAEARHNEPSTAHRSSMKSRIKALITEEVCRKKVRHRRSTSYPIRQPTDDSIPIPTHHKLHSLSIGEENHTDHSHHVRVNYLKQSEVDLLGKEPVKDHTLVHGNLIYAIEPSKDDSLHESKLFMNALTLLNLREEMFLKILKDPNSSLATQMHVRQPNLRLGLNKSMSFSAPAPPPAPSGSSRHSDVGSSRRIDEHSEEEDQKLPREAEVLESVPPPTNIVRKKSDDRVGLMRFKSIREKIKFVIRDRKKEKNRIMMDALHHKVPFGTSPSKKLSEDIEHQGSDFGSSQPQTYKRTSSFDNSLDRYNQLIDTSSSKEAKDHHSSDESKLKIADVKPPIPRKRPALGRILSSPEIRSYIRANINEAPDTVSASHEKKPLHQLDSEDKDVTCSAPENENQEEVLLSGDEPADSKAEEGGSSHDSEGESEKSPPQPSKPETDEVSVNDSECHKDKASVSDDSKPCERPHTPSKEESSDLHESHGETQEMDSWLLSQDMIDLDVEGELDLFESHVSEDAVGIVQESQIQQFYSDLMHVEVDDKNKAEFNYVKGVLELSGFSKNEPLGEWQSAEHPLDPSMFEEVGGCSAEQQEFYGNEEMICNQLMLFDLINEVLLQVHERSFCYWPTPLTNRSTIHPLPKGSRVLEEVWAEIRWLLRSRPESVDDEDDTDDAVSRNLAKNDGWMNLQLDAECVGIELEELIFDDLLQQVFAA